MNWKVFFVHRLQQSGKITVFVLLSLCDSLDVDVIRYTEVLKHLQHSRTVIVHTSWKCTEKNVKDLVKGKENKGKKKILTKKKKLAAAALLVRDLHYLAPAHLGSSCL